MASFVANFFMPSKLKPWLLALMALVSILSFSFAYAIRRQKTSASLDVNLPEVYFNKNEKDIDHESGLNINKKEQDHESGSNIYETVK